MVQLPGNRLGRYRIIEQIGRGGMATVYRAHDPSLHRDVAIKVLSSLSVNDPTFSERFTAEARTIARLNHPNILRIYDFGEDQGYSYIVTELLMGGTVQENVLGALPIRDALELLRPLADALDYAHAEGVIHRDIKPSNVLLDSWSRPVLADFGLSRVMEQVYHLTSPREAIGTPEYISPEQALGRNTDKRSDLYSFAILVYQLIVGQTPFHADTPTATLMAHVHQEIPFPDTGNADLTPAVQAVLVKGAAKEPSERYASAVEMINALAVAAGYSAGIPAQESDQTIVIPATTSRTQAGSGWVQVGQTGTASGVSRLSRYANRWTAIGGATGGLILVAVVALILMRDVGGAPIQQPRDTPVVIPVTQPAPVDTPAAALTAVPTVLPSVAQILRSADEILETISVIQGNVTRLRGLDPIARIEPRFLTTAELEELADAYFKRRFLRQQVFEAEELYKTLGLMDEDLDLEQITRDLLVQQVSALFDDQSGELYVLSDSPFFGSVEELAYASVYLAGLQEQRFDVSGLRQNARDAGNFDSLRAVTAFITGDVMQVQSGYVANYFDDSQRAELRVPIPNNLLASAPDVVRKTVIFPQVEGANFVFDVYGASGGWRGVDSVYRSPPVSTEQIIHPEKYIAAEMPDLPDIPDLLELLGRGWNELSASTLGEFLLRTYLEQHLDPVSASFAAEGWGGDRYVLLIDSSGQKVLALMINWDSADDEAEFARLYRQFADGATEGKLIGRMVTGRELRWVTRDQTILLKRLESRSVLILAGSDDLALTVGEWFEP